MAWQTHPDGSTHCDVCNAEFRAPRSCNCPRNLPRVVVDARRGPMEALRAEALALKMLDRLGLERLLAARIRKADREATDHKRAMGKCIKQGVERMGPDGPIAADADAAAVKWGALAESALGRGDKLARALYTLVADRERRADLERQERLAEAALGKSKPAAARAN